MLWTPLDLKTVRFKTRWISSKLTSRSSRLDLLLVPFAIIPLYFTFIQTVLVYLSSAFSINTPHVILVTLPIPLFSFPLLSSAFPLVKVLVLFILRLRPYQLQSVETLYEFDKVVVMGF